MKEDNQIVFTPGVASGGAGINKRGVVVMLCIMPGPKGQIPGKNIHLKEGY
jgi:hypothetical protein